MFSALIKAFTGRAGWLASLLALLIVAVIAYAAVTGAPRIQQKRQADAQTTPQPALAELQAEKQVNEAHTTIEADTDKQAESPTTSLSGEVKGSEGAEGGDTETALINTEQEDDTVSTTATDAQGGTSESEEIPAEAASDADSGQVLDTSSQADDIHTSEQSSLALRYDGLKLNLTGHLADDQLAQLITEEVRNAIPRDFELTAKVDGDGGASPLNWMGQFLAAIARLPDDAQGVITGSDMDGVQIIPDAEQKLVMAPLDESGNTKPLGEEDQTTEAKLDDPGAASLSDSDPGGEQEDVARADMGDPADFILSLNKRLAAQPMFATGDIDIGVQLAEELDRLVAMLQQHPSLLLRIVGNLDFGVSPRDAEYVGEDRARHIRDYLRAQGIESSRVLAAPLPRDYAFDERVQVVFYISE